MHKIRNYICIAIIAPVLGSLCFLDIIIAGIPRLFGAKALSRAITYKMMTPVVLWIFLIACGKLDIQGKENIPPKGEKFVIMPNHQSMLDIPAVFISGLWSSVIAKKELGRIPLLHGILMMMDCLMLDRSSPREALKIIGQGVDAVNSGLPVCIFAEGTRSKDGNLGQMKGGSFKIAVRAKAKILPVVIQNTRAIMESSYTFRRLPVYVRILPAIDTATLSEEELKELPSIVQERVQKVYEELPAYWGVHKTALK